MAVDPTTLPAGVSQTFDADGALDHQTMRTLAVGQVDLAADFGYAGTGSVGDFVWLDINGDGVQDTDEPGIPDVGVTATWAGVDGALDTADDVVYPTVTTDADGLYLVDNIPAGHVRVTVDTTTLPAGVVATFDLDDVLDSTTVRNLGAGENATDVDFGYTGTGSVGDFVWLDVNADELQDVGEPGIPGVDVTVTWAGFDGVLGNADDVVYPTDTTDAVGLYTVINVPAGPVRVTIDTATLPDGVEATFDLDGGVDSTADRLLGAGEAAIDVDFGYTGTGSVGDFVWLDLNGDGVQDLPREPGIPEVDVTATWAGFDGDLDTADDNVDYPLATTDEDGLYLVDNLPAGPVRVTVDIGTLPGGLVPTFDLDGALDSTADRTLAAGEDATDVDFGYEGDNEVGDLVWLDVNRDGDGPDTAHRPQPSSTEPGSPASSSSAAGQASTTSSTQPTTSLPRRPRMPTGVGDSTGCRTGWAG